MTPRQKELVQETFSKIEPIALEASTMFYSRLFEIEPTVKTLFKTDLETQGMNLMKSIGLAVNNLDNLGKVVPAIEALGKRHIDYGVKAHHFESVGKALLWTLEQKLGEAFTPEVKEAWGIVYSLLADTMKTAAYG